MSIILRTRITLTACVILHSIANSQTSGPSQPEVQSFQPVSITNMVDKSSGQFLYNIPLFTIGNYPVTVNYNSNVGLDNEASIVGLGFNLNCGAITRSVRGLPDDFNGDETIKRVNMKPNRTFGIDLGLSLEFVGYDKEMAKKLSRNYGINLSMGSGLFWNNYQGWGIESKLGAGMHANLSGLSGNAGIGLTSNSQHRTSVNPYAGISWSYKRKEKEAEQAVKEETQKYRLRDAKFPPQYPGLGGSISFNSQGYSPKIDLPFTNYSFDFSVKLGYAGALSAIEGDIRGYYNEQKITNKTFSNPAYGFLYSENGKHLSQALMDFSREKDGLVTEETKNMAVPFTNQDIYTVAGHGLGGNYELKRNNVFIGFDPAMQSNSHSGGAEIELAAGTGAHAGAAVRYGYTVNNSKKWDSMNNKILNELDFIPIHTSSNPLGENVFFKNPADVMFNNNPIFSSTQDKPLAPRLYNIFNWGGGTKNATLNYNGSNLNIGSGTFVNYGRQARLDVIYYSTADWASKFGTEKTISSYALNNFSNQPAYLNRIGAVRKADHLSELICLKPTGERYVFNIPAYNIEMKDYSWSLNDTEVNGDYETTSIPDFAGLKNTNGGKDEYISETTTPGYAHSFLLGSVLSANYIDVDDNGPSINDIGDYVKFNYSRVYDDYYWKSNNTAGLASAGKGNLADPRDAKGFYQDGKKEIWYLHSIESKNEVARLFYSDRTDALNINNTVQKLKRLDSVYVYTRAELQNTTPVPFKRVYFEFEDNINSLCKRNGTGKLTLKKIYFKDGTSNKGKYSAYNFSYANNPVYNSMEQDRWSNHKPNSQSTAGLNLDNKEFPFVNQYDSKNQVDQYAQAWLLNKIELPSGGEVTVNYEAHDYSFVQNKKAMYMASVAGFALSPNNLTSTGQLDNKLHSGSGNYFSGNYLVFKLKKNIPGYLTNTQANSFVKNKCFTDYNDPVYGRLIENGSADYAANIFGKFRVFLNADNGYEDIPVFMGAIECGALKLNNSNDYNYGYIRLKAVAVERNGTENTNPIAATTCQFVKSNYPNILFGFNQDPQLTGGEGPKLIASVLNPAGEALRSVLRVNPIKKLLNDNVAASIDVTKSYIRVYDYTGFKMGAAGARVKQIVISDNWDGMTANNASASTYSINYDYKKVIGKDTISSGVLSYEPETGGEENPFKQPAYYKIKNTLQADEKSYLMTPFGESLFPAPSLVYSEVKTTTNPVNNLTQVKGNGYTVDKFYTLQDFPCYTDNTNIELKHNPKFKFSLLKNLARTYLVAAQGYSVVTNDMHGKSKSEEVFNEAAETVSGKYYYYKTKNGKLDNYVTAVKPDSQIVYNQLLGVETSLCGDARSITTETFYGNVSANIDGSFPPPAAAPSVWPDASYEKKTFNSSVLTKFIRQQGILDSVVVVDKGSRIRTENILWDIKTGAVLLTKTYNEFRDSVYNFTYPAHWAYKEMGMASDNISMQFTGSISNITNTAALNALNVGDILGADNGEKYILTGTSAGGVQYKALYTGVSNTPPAGLFKIISSGKRNLAATAIGNLVSMKNPFSAIGLNVTAATRVIDATATEYVKEISLPCDTCSYSRLSGNFLSGIKIDNQSFKLLAPWQQQTAYKFIGDRVQTLPNPNLRKDGYINGFTPFWNAPLIQNGFWNKTTNPLWQFTSKVSYVDKKTNPVESYNPLNIFSHSQPSNFDGFTYAVINNSRYFENLFENFEEQLTNCETNHFQITLLNGASLDKNIAHTGFYSMSTPGNGFISVIPPSILQLSKLNTVNSECTPSGLIFLPGKKYIFSAWVKQKNYDYNMFDYTQANVNVKTISGTVITSCLPKGQIIDGWQRIEQEFIAPPLSPNGSFAGLKIDYAPNCNYDDIRIFPADAVMKSCVYSYKNYSLMAILDENNFATLYEYDQQQQLKRVKKETEKGIVTIQEVNFSSHKQ